MAEINNVIAEASQDLQTIEDFVNLPADSEVYPRLLPSVNVGTLAGARQAIFEAGGLPAKPFTTKALMTASALVDGDYAMVTDDTVNNNGLYVKTSGNWLLSKYDINQKAFIHRGVVATGTALASYTTAGTYSVPAGITITDAPVGMLSNKNYMLVNVHAWDNGAIIVQTLEGAADVKEKWGRVIRKDGTIFSGWKSFKVEANDLVGNYSYRGTLTANSNLDDAVESGLYLVTGAATNLPDGAPATAYKLNVDVYGTFVKQTLYDNSSSDKVWERSFRTTGSSNTSWVYRGKTIATQYRLGEVIAGNGLTINEFGVLSTSFGGSDGLIGSNALSAKYDYRKSLTKETDDLNELYASGNYVVVGYLVPNRPADAVNVGFLTVKAMGSSAIQIWVNDDSINTTYIRKIQSVTGAGTNARDWYCLNTEHISHVASASKRGTIKVGANLSITADGLLSASGSGGSAAFQGKKLLCFGDSITEFKNYPELVGARLGANALNVGFGGCRMAKHNSTDYNEMSMYRLADNIGLNDYTELLAGAQAVFTRVGDDNRPQANLLANADFNTVDYITIMYGTNDFANSVPMGVNTDVTADGSTFKGSINYSIKRILETHPHVKILLIAPPFRFRAGDDGGADSDDAPNSLGKFMIEYIDAIVELGALNKVPVLDLYRESGINKYTAPLYLNPPPDGVHLSQTGAELVAAKIASKLIATY